MFPLNNLEDNEENEAPIQVDLEDEVIKEALQTGLDLRQYSRQVEEELHEAERSSIQDYIKESKNIAYLHDQITACDGILEKLEGMLLGFQGDLGNISSEILSLQKQSIELSIRLSNRQGVRGELNQFVDEMVVPESLIHHILETPVTEKDFMESLYSLDNKINFVKEQSFRECRSSQDVQDVVEKLKIKSIAKIREYLLQRIYQLRKPMTNYQIPQNALLKHKFFYKFLVAQERSIAKEVRDEYVHTLSKIYYSYFKAYATRLMRLQYEEAASKEDLLGVEDTVTRGLFSKPNIKAKSTVFTLGNRGTVLTTDLEAPILVPHAAQKNETKYPFEALFRSQQFALVDNACREYLFLSEFFMVQGTAAQDLFNNVFGKTLHVYARELEEFVQHCYDSVAIFLSIHLIFRYQLLCHKRAVPALDGYWDTLLNFLWPRFEHILQLNIQSVNECDPQRFTTVDMRPHYITRRYAEFSAALVGINESFPNEKVNRLLAQLQEAVEHFILKMAAVFPQRKNQLIFLINNYDMMLGVISERTRDDSKESETFKEQLSSRTAEYVEEMLGQQFGGIIHFVKECENAIEKGQSDSLRKDERKAQSLIQSFSMGWKKSLDDINREILSSFPNFKNGTNILQATLTQFVQYYHRFQKILSQHPFRNLPARTDLINIHQLMVEVKKYKPTF